jgi:hypothetical protein
MTLVQYTYCSVVSQKISFYRSSPFQYTYSTVNHGIGGRNGFLWFMKGTVSGDLRPSVFFTCQSPFGLWLTS